MPIEFDIIIRFILILAIGIRMGMVWEQWKNNKKEQSVSPDLRVKRVKQQWKLRNDRTTT